MNRLILLLFLSPLFLSAQKETNDKESASLGAADGARLVLGKQKLYAGQFVNALNVFREIETSNQKNATVKYYVGLCQYNLGNKAEAMSTLQKAVALGQDIKPETYLLLGKVYQSEEKYDDALNNLNLFKSSGKGGKEDVEDAELHISQCTVAKTLMANPVAVKISPLGGNINSKYDDKNPCVTADGKRIVFTTRRPETTSDPVDVEGDGKHFENIYLVNMDSTGKFATASNAGSSINTKGHDACTSISPDGRQLFIYKNDMNDRRAIGGNIFVSKFTNGKWKNPEPLGKPINTSYWEGGACISPDGKKCFFTSERKGGFGNSDIWMSEKINKNEWGPPVNLGEQVNTKYDEAGMFLAPDGKTLFFCSNGPGSMGGYDIFRTVYENGKWSAPMNVGYPINSAAKEGQFSVSADQRYAYFSSDRKGGLGESDIYVVELGDYAILEKEGKRASANGLSILRGTIRDGSEGFVMQDVEVTLKDAQGKEVNKITTDDSGQYFFTLPAGTYELALKRKGYKDVSEKVDVPKSEKETITVEKGFLLSK
jgi:hypothetical protein